MSRSYAKCWCFTLNNPQQGETIPQDVYDYCVVGNEVGEEGTPHFQGYVIFKKPMLLTGVKKILTRAHWEVAKGTPQQNFDYCSKDGDFEERGVRPAPKTAMATLAKKQNYDAAVALAKQQKIYDVDSGMLLRHMAALKAISRDHPPELADNDYLCGEWFVGPPGTGKSRAARWLYPKAFPKPCNKWWDGYQHEEFVIIDDFDMNHHVLGHHLKIWADHYPFTAEIKGTSIRIRPAIICVTSNYTPEEIFSSDPVLCAAIKRRYKITTFK